MAANETQEPDIIINIDKVVHAKVCRWLISECSLNLRNSLENAITRKKYFHILENEVKVKVSL
jgi:hypothetical protein